MASACKIDEWILYSGSSFHMTNNKNLFKNLHNVKTEIGTAKKNQALEAGRIDVVETNKVVLNKVLYVEEVAKNLLSVNAITENGGKVIFIKDKAEIWKDKTKLTGYRNEDSLWTINLDQVSRNALLAQEVKTALRWHQKLASWKRQFGKTLNYV